MKFFSILILIIIAPFIGCKKNSDTPTNPASGLIKIADGYARGAATEVQVYTYDSLLTGYNKMVIVLKDSVTGNYINNASISINPEMNMMSMFMTCPVENPSQTATGNVFNCAVSYTMATMTNEPWCLLFTVKNLENNKTGVTDSLPIVVVNPAYPRFFSINPYDNSAYKYFIFFAQPLKPAIGNNTVELVVNKLVPQTGGGYLYLADSSMTINMMPEMPVMSMNITGTVNPTHIGNGHYKGQANLSMTGLWELDLGFYHQTTAVDTTHYFQFSF